MHCDHCGDAPLQIRSDDGISDGLGLQFGECVGAVEDFGTGEEGSAAGGEFEVKIPIQVDTLQREMGFAEIFEIY